jgi:NADPH:quinone reductase-like Zn-dependent oxidoreductase
VIEHGTEADLVCNECGELITTLAIADLEKALAQFLAQQMSVKSISFFIARVNKEDLTVVRELMATAKVTPVIDRRYRLREAAEAFRYMEEGHARGKVVITLDENDKA